MMPGISILMDSDAEGVHHYINEDSLLSSASESASKQVAPAKKTKKRKCVTMPKTKSKVIKSSPDVAPHVITKKVPGTKRKALEEYIDDEGVQETQILNAAQQTTTKPKARDRPARQAKPNKTVESELENMDDMEIDQIPMIACSTHAASKSGNPRPHIIKNTKTTMSKPKISPEAIQESQPTGTESEVDELEVATAKSQPLRARTQSRTRQEPQYRRRAGSASDTERGDPNLRRKLGDITRKFENIDARYRNLKEVGIVEANANVEKLRRQCEATAEASNNLVTSLKKELAITEPLAHDARRMCSELDAYKIEVDTLRATNTDLSSSLSSAQNEIKTLQAKLAAARKASVEPAASTTNKTPKATSNRSIVLSSNASTESIQIAQMKIDLYSDLSGLIIRSVKRAEDGDTYDCIQTGRNGTLHFKLFIDAEDAKSASFEDIEFLYTPLLDADRDHEMIELMPAYLTEDITFARQNAAKFYQRVVDTLTRKIEKDED